MVQQKLNLVLVISTEMKISHAQIEAVFSLFDEGCTIPFIARYRKEATGSLDEVSIARIRDRREELLELEKRRLAILKSLEDREILTDELAQAINDAVNLTTLEDTYLPYRPKRKTRASMALEKGLAPLAENIMGQDGCNPRHEAKAFINIEQGVENIEEALKGALDIIAERVNENSEARNICRRIFARHSYITSALVSEKENEAAKYKDYFSWRERAIQAPSHRILALFRGENEGMLSLKIQPDEMLCLSALKKLFIKTKGEEADLFEEAITDGYKRLLSPSMETELRNALKKRADEEAISVFAQNIREILMTPPLGYKNILAVDPGFRTGCKVVCLNRQGSLIFTDTIYPHPPINRQEESAKKIREIVNKFSIEAIAIGNGTAGRETETFIKTLNLPQNIITTMVNESGASVYSASEIARKEFPDHDVTIRGAVSIGRRLMDPLAELIKIDPRSLGVGQYQHDVDQKALKRALDDAVMSCVNAVGVDINTASRELLTFVSGVGPQLAANIVKYREENGLFNTRNDLKKVPRLGPKSFQQCAGFLRIQGGVNPLDSSAVHPENYALVKNMASDLNTTVKELMGKAEIRQRIDITRYVKGEIGLPTLKDIMEELEKPGRDPRCIFEEFSFVDGITDISHLKKGMVIPGIITNVTAFGAFVDIGVHQDGLIHISALSDKYISSPHAVVSPGQQVKVIVMDIDMDRKRISLSMKKSDLEEK